MTLEMHFSEVTQPDFLEDAVFTFILMDYEI